jgi:predicted DNA-binding transcriptional regulator AlpA
VTPLADPLQLGLGRLVFPPELNGKNRKPSPIDALIDWADPITLRPMLDGAERHDGELWCLVALSLHLDPGRLNTSGLLQLAESQTGEISVATLFRDRLEFALQHLANGTLPSWNATAKERAGINFAMFACWADVCRIKLPSYFPGVPGWDGVVRQAVENLDRELWADQEAFRRAQRSMAPDIPAEESLAHTPSKRRSARTPPDLEAGLLRVPDVLAMVRFSRATLWRKVKDGTFPPPFKVSAGICTWQGEAVAAWIKGQGTSPAPKRKARAKSA